MFFTLFGLGLLGLICTLLYWLAVNARREMMGDMLKNFDRSVAGPWGIPKHYKIVYFPKLNSAYGKGVGDWSYVLVHRKFSLELIYDHDNSKLTAKLFASSVEPTWQLTDSENQVFPKAFAQLNRELSLYCPYVPD